MMENPFPPFDPDGVSSVAASGKNGQRLRDMPLRSVFPSLLTLLAIAAGLSAIRFSAENRIELAVVAIIFAAFLDGIDGRVARLLKSASRFGAELDSLADFVNFGVAPAMLLYFTLLDRAGSVGWIATLIFAICNCLRLARFNVQLDQPHKQPWQSQFFTGAPAPAGAMLVLAPVYVELLGAEPSPAFAVLASFYALGVGLLMVSRLPTWSGKDFGRRVPRAQVLPLLIAIVAFVGLLFSYPWGTLLTCIALYFATLPLSFRDYQRRAAQAARQAAPGDAVPGDDGTSDATGDKAGTAKSAH